MVELADVLTDLRHESESLDSLVAPLDAATWRRPTPAPGWTIAHQVAHLAWTDERALLAVTDPAGFLAELATIDPARFVDEGADAGALLTPTTLLSRWRTSRARLADALAGTPDTRFPWYGPPMSGTSMATARIMETWAHGEDVADALGVSRPPTGRLRHIAHLGVRTRSFGFAVRGLEPPPAEPRVELTTPDGGLWTWGPADAADRVTGPALDFCLLVTQRRHRADVALRAEGTGADRWLDIAQAFAGPPGPGRPRATPAAADPAPVPAEGVR
ncbi:TIGR03084 family metal-binding protein [Longispora sp. NPDC051575]|uniref:TIGR03084 family metal-binding protein n=1 Tax=Longispora sp. NPDC051575 TaxID=3154943 RepID=UPI00341C7F9C